MSEMAGRAQSEGPEEAACLVRTVRAAMADEPALEAVRIDHGQRSVAIATLGQPRTAGLEAALTSRIQALEAAAGTGRCELLEGASDCGHCLTSTADLPQGLKIESDAAHTTISRVTCPTAPRFWRWRHLALPKLVPRELSLPEDDGHEHEWKLQLAAAGLCGAAALGAWLSGGGRVALLLHLLAYLAGSWFTVEEIWERLRKGVLDVHFLMLTVAVGSASIGAWSEGAILLFLFSFSGALEHYAMGRTHREIRSLFKTAPKVATRLDSAGRESVVPVDQLQQGMRLLIRPGDQFPVDAELALGRTACDESTLTGEAVPVDKNVGDTVYAGTINLWGAVEVTVLRAASESALQKVIRLIQEAQHLKAPVQRFTDRFSTGYTYGVLGLSTAMFLVWWLVLGHSPFVSSSGDRSAFYRAMTLLVVASPCALVLSIPSAVLAAIAWGARRGILFRGGAAVEKLAQVEVVALDKTGTLTTGDLKVERVDSEPPGREAEVAQLAFSLERLSTHPLARAILRHGKQQGLPALATERVSSVPGQGIRGWVNGVEVLLGRRDWVFSGVQAPPGGVESGRTGHSEIWVRAGDLRGRILLRDDVRPEARGLVQALRARGLHVMVLTGDRKAAAEPLAKELGLEDVRAELTPEAKVEAIGAMTEAGRKPVMIGDGVNDAPSLAAAYVGVAMGARGADAALEQAEVVLMHDRLENFLAALDLSRRARRIIYQNLGVSLGTVVVLVALALMGGIPLTLGVMGHEGSTVVVVLNSLRLLWGRAPAS